MDGGERGERQECIRVEGAKPFPGVGTAAGPSHVSLERFGCCSGDHGCTVPEILGSQIPVATTVLS